MPPIEVIINAAGGSFVQNETEELLQKAFADRGIEANIRLARDGSEIAEMTKEAAAGDADIIVGGGGDGTIGLVAAAASKNNKILGVLPLGTLNHFSKDLGIPASLKEAIAIIAKKHTIDVDMAEVNGRTFINNSSIGLYPRIVRSREAQQQRLGRGKWYAALVAALKVLKVNSFLRIRFHLDDSQFYRKTPFVFIGNNEYQMDLYNIGKRERLDSGTLSVYLVKGSGRWGVVGLLFKTIFGRLKQAEEFESFNTDAMAIRTRKKTLMVAMDGEVRTMETPLKYKILPGALRVIVPEPAPQSDA